MPVIRVRRTQTGLRVRKFQRVCAEDLADFDVEAGMGIYCPNAPVIDAMTVNWLV
jgi:hypothetical protein